MRKSKKTNSKKSSKKSEDKSPVKNPHNNFFIKLFERTKSARKYLKSRLPKKIVEDIDWRTLKPSKVSWMDGKLKAVYSDINFTVKWKGKDIYLPVVLEHQSSKPTIPHLKMLRYLLNGYDYQVEQIKLKKKEGNLPKGENSKLTVIIPLFLYHGKKKWKFRPFYEFFDYVNEDIFEFIPNFKYLLDNLSIIPNEELYEQEDLGILSAAFLLMKNYRDKDYIVSFTAKIIAMAGHHENNTYYQFFAKMALTYVASSPEIKRSDIDIIINSVDKSEKNLLMNAIEEYQQEAAEAASAQTRETVLKKVVTNLLQDVPNFSDKKIASLANVPISFVQQIKKELQEKK